MGAAAGGIVRAEGEVVTSTPSTSRVVVQVLDATTGQYSPRQITVGDLLTGGGTSFTPGSVIFAGAGGDLAEDNTNLNFNDATNALTVGGALTVGTTITATLGNITATNGNVVANTAGKGLVIKIGSNARAGTSTLTGGTVTVSNTSVTANTLIFLTARAINASTATGRLTVGPITANTSFVINALKADATVETNDVSSVSWLLVETA